jgi:hypothetical protein
MIPYDDLVAALSAWRARQGLPVSTTGASSGPTPTPGSGPHDRPGSGPNRPPPPPAWQAAPAAQEPMEVDDAAMLEEQYENDGDDFAMAFGSSAEVPGDDATSIGSVPESPADPSELRRDDRDDW